MKRLLMLTAILTLGCAMVFAQTKKPAPKQPSGKHAVIQLHGRAEVKGMTEGSNKLYLNTGDKVYSVDKVTGDVKVELTNDTEGLLLGKGVRSIAAVQTNLYYWVASKGLFMKGTEQDKPIFYDEDVVATYMEASPTGEHLLIFGRGGHSLCVDLKQMASTPKYPGSAYCMAMSGGKVYLIGTDGHITCVPTVKDTIESTAEFKPVVTMYRTGQRPERYTDRISATEVFIDKGTDKYDSFAFVTNAPSGEAYTAVKNRLLEVPSFKDVLDYKDDNVEIKAFTCRGNKAFINSGYYEYPLIEIDGFRTGNETITKHKELKTDILEPKLYTGAPDRYFKNNRFWQMYVDTDGNLWCVGEYGKVFVYNSKGIKGYRNLKGKLVKVEQ